MPTRLRNASTEDSPQYPAAIAAGIRRGQEPIGMMAERRIAETKKLTSHETDRAAPGITTAGGSWKSLSVLVPRAELLIAIKHSAQESLNCKQSKVASSSAQVRPLAVPQYD